MNWWTWRIWMAGRDPMHEIERWPIKRLLAAHKVLDFEAERERIYLPE